MKPKLLLISAHPDDDAQVTGTLLKIKKRGWQLFEIILTKGGNGTKRGKKCSFLSTRRKKEGEIFAKLLGMKKIYWFNETDGFLTKNKTLVVRLLKIIRKVSPKIIILLNPNDYHKDHRESYTISLEAIELATRNSYFAFGRPLKDAPLILITDGLNLLENPDVIVDVSCEFNQKIRLIKKAYASQLDESLLNFIKGLALVRGARIKVKYGEAFNFGRICSRPTISFRISQILAELLND